MKQKGLRKLVSMILAVVMCLGLTCTAFATTEVTYSGNDAGTGIITINNAAANETYTVYQMLTLTYDATNSAYAYKVANGWSNFFTTGAGATYFEIDGNGYVTVKTDEDSGNALLESDSDEMAELAKAALEYAQDTTNGVSQTASGVADSTGITFGDLPLGYYLVDTTLGTLCSIDTTDEEVKINEKNSSEPEDEKTVKEENDDNYSVSATAGIGETVNYQVTIENAGSKSNVVMTDTMSKGLTLDKDETTGDAIVKVTIVDKDNAETTVEAVDSTSNETNYTVETKTNDDGETVLTVKFEDSFLETVATTDTIVITYSATVNKDAVIGSDGNGNREQVTYGNDQKTAGDTATVYTYNFTLTKTDADGNELSGATFNLYIEEGEYFEFVKETTTETVEIDGVETEVTKVTYRKATQDEINDGNTTSDIEVGSAIISGLDAGTYWLTETVTPDGYNSLKSNMKVEISETGSVTVSTSDNYDSASVSSGEVKVVNNSGTELPSTGGVGTGIFYIVGGVLVMGAAVLLITRRRLGSGK